MGCAAIASLSFQAQATDNQFEVDCSMCCYSLFPVSKWEKDHGLGYLSIPRYIASGLHERDGMTYRFMVMQRFGEDLEKKFSSVGRKFGMKTVCYLALHLVSPSFMRHLGQHVLSLCPLL